MRFAQKLLHVDAHGIISVALLVECGVGGDGEACELGSAIHRAIVVGAYHVCSHRLAEAARAADAGVFAFGVYQAVEPGNHGALVDINL